MSAALLLALACKTGLVAGLALAGAALLRSRPARERVVLLRLGLVMVAALPLVSQQAPALRIEAPAGLERLAAAARLARPAEDAEAPAAAAPAASAPAAARPAAEPAAHAFSAVGPWAVLAALVPAAPPTGVEPAARALPAVGLWAVLGALYALGVAALLLRLAGGVLALVRRTREAHPVEDARWLAALDRAAGAGPRPRLLAAPRPLSPLSWGVRPGVILIGPDALAQADRADAVLTHELAHIRHGDWLFLMLSRLLVALFWFNPLVWLLQRELGRQSEHAADAWAVRRVSRLDYAGALVAMARSGRPHAALGMADSELARRVKTVLDNPAVRGRPWSTAVAAVACVGLAGPLAALELAPSARKALIAPAAAPSPAPAADAPALAPLAAIAAGGVPDTSLPAAASPPPAVAPADPPAAPGAENLRNGAQALDASAAHLRAQADNPDLRPHERARLHQEAAGVEARAAHMRHQASTIDARHAAQMNVSVDVRMGPMPGAFIGAADMRNAAEQMRADAAGMAAHADSLSSGALPAPPGGAREIDALHRQAEALRRQADALDREADGLGPP